MIRVAIITVWLALLVLLFAAFIPAPMWADVLTRIQSRAK